jgi:hypothetical protein
MDLALSKKPADPVSEHPGLAGARTGDDEQWSALVQDSGALLRVQPLEQGRRGI